MRADLVGRISSLALISMLVLGLLLPASGMAIAQVQRDINLTIMLEKVRASAVLIITIVKAAIIWEDFIPRLREVGLDPIIEVL